MPKIIFPPLQGLPRGLSIERPEAFLPAAPHSVLPKGHVCSAAQFLTFYYLGYCFPGGPVVTITSTRSSGTIKPLTPIISSTLTATALLPCSKRAVKPAPSPANRDSRIGSLAIILARFVFPMTCSGDAKEPPGTEVFGHGMVLI